jgi:tRNA(fMet)-specific endonuclease VapC
MRYLLDTNVISELVARQPNRAVVAWIDGLDANSVYLSVITIGEIRKGIEKLQPSTRRERLSAWLADELLVRFDGRIAAITTDVMLVWGELTGRLEMAGHPIAAIDSLIGAIALEGKFCLVTRTTADFRHTGATLFDPWADPLGTAPSGLVG